MKFSDKFYPDVISYASNSGEKTIMTSHTERRAMTTS